MSFFTVWGLILMLLKCLGPFYVGVFSGYPYQYEGCASRTGRGLFLFSSMMVMLFSILAISQGLTGLHDTTDTIDAANQDVVKIQTEFQELVSVLDSKARSALPIRDQLVSLLKDDICPLLPDGNMVLRQAGNQTFSSLTELENFLADDLKKFEKVMRQVAHATKEIDTAVQNLEFTTGAAVGIMIPFFIIPSLLAVALLMGWTETYYDAFFTFTEWFTMPVFIVMIIFAYVACGFVVMATEGNADFCVSGSTSTPQSAILNILERYNLMEGELYYDAVKFYSHQCLVDNPFAFLEIYYDNLVAVEASLAVLEATISGASPINLSQQCGIDYSATLELVWQLQAHIEILGDATKRSLQLLQCSSVVPLYTNSVYKATCDNNVTAALWLFSCSFIICIFGMLMITLRGACYPLLPWDDEKDLYSTESSDLDIVEIDTGDNDGYEVEGASSSLSMNLKNEIASGFEDSDPKR
jgi:hypothetical protein